MSEWIDFYNAVDTTYRDKRGDPLNPDEPEEEWRYREPERRGIWTLIKQDVNKSVCLERPDGFETFGWMMNSRWEQRAYHSIAQGARGKMLMAGLGVGWEAFVLDDVDDVESVTVVEIDADIIELSSPVLAGKRKISIVNNSILRFMESTRERFDTVYFDIYPSDPNRFPEETALLTEAASRILREDGKIMFWRMYRPLEL